MNIIYAVCGDGHGHAFRSSIVLDHLEKQGHKLAIVASNKAYDVLSKKYPHVNRVSGLKLVYEDNRVKRSKTIVKNVSKVKDLPKNIKVVRGVAKEFKPDVVISDFEPAATLISAFYNVPLISIDNNHIISDAKLKVKREDIPYYLVSKVVVDSILPSRDYSLITTFFYPQLKKKRKDDTWLVPPLIRKQILDTKPAVGEHILVYQTSDSYKDLLNVLTSVDEKFVIYNGSRAIAGDNLVFRDYDEKQIVEDMAKAKGVIANGGFTLISESLYLGKPVLSIPIKMQYEQILNGRMIENMGFGKMTFRLTKAVLEEWLHMLDSYSSEVAKIHFSNQDVFVKLDRILEQVDL